MSEPMAPLGPITPVRCPDHGHRCYWTVFGIPDKYTEARAYELARHRAEKHGEPLTPELVAYAVTRGYDLPADDEAGKGTAPSGKSTRAEQPLTAEQEQAIRDRVAAATKGPWGAYTFGGDTLIEIAADLEETGTGYRARREICRLEDEPIDNDPAHREWTAEEDWAQVQADAEFTAHARTDVPALLAELDRTRARVAELEARPSRAEVLREAEAAAVAVARAEGGMGTELDQAAQGGAARATAAIRRLAEAAEAGEGRG